MPAVTPPVPPPQLLRYQRSLNRNSAPRWDGYAGHRERMMALLAQTRGSLALLGAGNCNDVDLPALVARHPEVHLIDLDDEALRRARDRQPPEVAARLVVHPPLDLSGGLERLTPSAAAAALRVDPDELARAAIDRLRAAIGATFDTVVSACLLTQITQSCRRGLGMDHPNVADIADGLLTVHLRTLPLLTKPGGTALLVTDAVSSETYPLDELYDQSSAASLLDQLEQTENILTGTAPRDLRRFFTRDPIAAPLLARPPQLVPPWLWQLGEEVTLLTYAWVLSRRE
jgi:hypothetical protein